MAELKDIALDKEIAEIRLLPGLFLVIIWGVALLPHQPTDVRFNLELLGWMTVVTLVLSALSFLSFFRHDNWRRNLVTVYQAIMLPLAAAELLSHRYHPMFLLIYLFMVSLMAFIGRYSRTRLMLFLVVATLIVVWHPFIEELQIQDFQVWQTALVLTFVWNACILAINIQVRDRQLLQTQSYLKTIEHSSQQQRAYAQQLYLERLHLQNIVDNVDVFIALVDKAGIIIQINQPFLDYIAAHGVSPDVIGKPIASLAANAERRNIVVSSIEAALQGQVTTGELYNDQVDKYLVWRYCPIKDNATGEIYGVGIYYRDITETYRAQQELRYSSRQLKAILDSIDQNVYLTDRHGRMINANKWAAEGRFGFKPAPPKGQLLLDNIEGEENRENYLRHHAEALQGKTIAVDFQMTSSKLWVQVKYMPAYGQDGLIFGVIVSVADISARKRNEDILLYALKKNKSAREQLKEREIMYRQLLDASPDQIALKDADSNYLWKNSRFREFYGEQPQTDPEAQAKARAEDLVVISKEAPLVYEHWERNQHGEDHLLRTIKAPIRGTGGKIEKIAVFSTDITEQNERIKTLEELLKAYQELSEQEQAKERALSESQATIQLLAENTSELIALSHANGYLKYVSPSWKKLTGFAPEEMMGRPLADFFHPDDLQRIQQIAENIRQNDSDYTVKHRIRHRNGRYIWLETIWKYIFDQRGTIIGIQTSSRDITERIAAEQAMQALFLRYQTLFNASYDAILILRVNPTDASDLTVVEANAAAHELLGYTTDELRAIDVLAMEHKISWAELRRRMKTLISRREILLETRVRKKNGEMVWVEIAVVPFQIDNEEYLQFTIRDISSRKQAEEAMKAKAVAEKSLEFKSTFLAKMSHEIRTPMNGLQGMTYMLLATPLDERQKKIVESIQHSTKGLLAILNDILDLSKLEAGKLTLDLAPMDLRRCIAEVHDLFSAVALEKNLLLNYVFAENIPAIIISDYNRLRQVINNLVSNAIKFTHQGAVTIIAELVEAADTHDLLKITVRDTGIGIHTDSFEHLFEKFYQGEAARGMGTGLGLAICKELVQLLGGEIGLKSTPKKGSSFWFTFKALRAPNELSQLPSPTVHYTYRAISAVHVLLAEDVPVNQEVAKWMLEEIGIQVTVADNGLIAYEQARNHRFDLILMDVNMPVMDGVTATGHIKAVLNPSPPIVGMSAHAMSGDADLFMAKGMDAYLTKPVTPEALYEILYRFLPDKIERHSVVEVSSPPEPKVTEAPLMSIAVVNHIKKLAGKNTGMLRGLLESFILDIGQSRQKIAATHAQASYAEMTKELHTLKGLCGTIGASRLFEYVNALYAQANDAPHSVTVEQLAQLFQLIEATAEVVQKEYLVNL